MSAVLDIVGLAALVVAGFLVALWLGFAVLGLSCLWVSWSQAQARRRSEAVRLDARST